MITHAPNSWGKMLLNFTFAALIRCASRCCAFSCGRRFQRFRVTTKEKAYAFSTYQSAFATPLAWLTITLLELFVLASQLVAQNRLPVDEQLELHVLHTFTVPSGFTMRGAAFVDSTTYIGWGRDGLLLAAVGKHPQWVRLADGLDLIGLRVATREPLVLEGVDAADGSVIELTADGRLVSRRRAMLAMELIQAVPGGDEWFIHGVTRDSARTQFILEQALDLPVFHPTVTAMAVGTDQRTWLRGPDEWRDTVAWEVLDPKGRLERIVHMDRKLEIVATDSTHVWAVVDDELNIPSLVRLRLVPRTPLGR